MKISEFIINQSTKYDWYLKIVKKWIFWILLDEDAFFMYKKFSLKLTVLDKQTIKVWFPDGSKDKWFEIFKEKNISYVLFEKQENEFIKTFEFRWTYDIKINLEDYNLTKERILWLKNIWVEEKNEKNFLLKDKLENIYILLNDLLLKLPKKQRYFFREKIERLFLDLFEEVYKYMYHLWDRKAIIKDIFNKTLILREYTKFLHKQWKIKNDNIYLDLWDRWLEVLKICKGIISKG